MNRFLSKKKGVEDAAALSPPQSGRKWRKTTKKAPLEEEKPKLDLTTVLPPSDDFRTSLIMPTLSTRFSMLREQDDPNTKMGKASDDSVLQPRRQSRLLDFGFSSNNLNDIAEVASIKSSIRPPFAARERQDSYGSEEGYGTDNDSTLNGGVMSRSRPGEGNVLFGGRQKVYKIPTASARSISSATDKGMGRIVYDDDINMSAFQRYRQQQQRDAEAEAEAPASMLLDHYENELDILSPDTDGSQGLSDGDCPVRDSEEPAQTIGLGLSHPDSNCGTFKRSSDSTTTSTPSQGRTSTAASSVASQSIGTAVTTPNAQPTITSVSVTPAAPALERSLTKRRLYDQGLEKNMHEQQASTLTRLNSIQRQRSPTVGSVTSPQASLAHSRSTGHMQERAFQPYVLQNSSQTAANKFPPLAPLRKPASIVTSPVGSYPQSPLSPTMSDSEIEDYNTLHSALEPSDRGKATAMGAFNRPKQQYDEEQYAQRQAQLQQSIQPEVSRQNSIDLAKHANSRLPRFDSGRQTNESHPDQRDPSRSIPSQSDQNSNKAFAVFQNAAIQNRVVHGENPHLPPAAPLPPAPTLADTHRTFFGDISASDDEEEDIVSDFERSGLHYTPSSYTVAPSSGRFTPTALHSVSEHPALRHETPNIPEVDEEEEEEGEEERILPIMLQTDVASVQAINTVPVELPCSSSEYKDIDSPTIGAKDGFGDIMRHLRDTSDLSSIFPVAQSSDGSTNEKPRGQDKLDFGHNAESHYAAANAWDLDELENYYGETVANRPASSQRDSTPARGQPFAPATSKANIYPSRPSTRESDVIDGGMWQYEFKKQHIRDTSTATQAERQAFDDELAARQRAIQEKMKSVVESESRNTSPAPTTAGALKAFGMLKSKPSREVMSRDGSSKTMKMLGLGGQGHQQDKYSIYEDPQASTSRIVPQGGTWAHTSNPQWPLAGPKEQKSGLGPQSTEGTKGLNGRSPLQHPATRERSRSRSNSAASRSRSRSRTVGHNDEHDAPPEVPQVPMVRPSIDTSNSMTPPSAAETAQGRMRSNSKPSGYFEPRGLHPAHNGTPNGRMTPGGISPASAVSPAGYSLSSASTPRPSYSTASSLSLSKAGSPAMGLPHVPAARPAGSLLRKKTINKADIGEPKLISSTSNVDTVDLSTARTIVQAPLIPALNPKRRVFAHGDRSPGDRVPVEGSRNAFNPPPPQHAVTFAGRANQSWDASSGQRKYARTVRSQESIDVHPARFDAIGSPVMNEAGMF